jgi:predicted DNA-binding transcriptional regulator AlpA
MSPENSSPEECAPSAASLSNVTLSRWVNERLPAWEQLLSAHDVARLTRRPRWWLLGMAVLGRFPRKQRFHGRGIGWLRCDVRDWLAKNLPNENCRIESVPLLRRSATHQRCRPLKCRSACAVQKSRTPRSLRRSGPVGLKAAPIGDRR